MLLFKQKTKTVFWLFEPLRKTGNFVFLIFKLPSISFHGVAKSRFDRQTTLYVLMYIYLKVSFVYLYCIYGDITIPVIAFYINIYTYLYSFFPFKFPFIYFTNLLLLKLYLYIIYLYISMIQTFSYFSILFF